MGIASLAPTTHVQPCDWADGSLTHNRLIFTVTLGFVKASEP